VAAASDERGGDGEGTVLNALLRGVIRAYQLGISPLLLPRCRYLPSCSDYATEAIATYGAGRGLWLALKRLSRCHPWGGSGYDPVPPRQASAPSCRDHRQA
jgi:uncharacterized protein